MSGDFVDEMIAKRTARDPDFPQKMQHARRRLATSYDDRHRAEPTDVPELAAHDEHQRGYFGQSGRTASE
jgi:hypothetical protein